MGTIFSYVVTCPKGVEDLLEAELKALGITELKMGSAAIALQGPMALAYRVCLWSRVANRVLCVLAEGDVEGESSDEQLYHLVSSIPWEAHISPEATFAIDFVGTNRFINNTQYGAVRVKDAIADRFSASMGKRPSVDKQSPDCRINVRLHKGKLAVALDLSGESLHKRGYRVATGIAPLKENLAAALLLRCGWPALAASGASLVDPMCGSGTFLIEAAWMAANKAPGLYRAFGFERWLGHDPILWSEIKQEALLAAEKGENSTDVRIWGFDSDPRVLKAATANIKNAECSAWVTLSVADVQSLECPEGANGGLLICNPPYGERLGEREALGALYLDLVQTAKRAFAGWQLGVFTGNVEAAQNMRLRVKKRNKLYNGPIASELLQFELMANDSAKLRMDAQTENELSEGAKMILNRLRKNQRRLSPWIKGQAVECYRLYDADMPEYCAAVDIYAGKVHLQEYAAPKTVDKSAAAKRLRELVSAVSIHTGVPKQDISLKTRKRNRGQVQYEANTHKVDKAFVVREGKAQFWVNLHDYLDTGLFLDHRPLRLKIAQEVLGKRFLNLFCYTATATVHAALGGAKQSVSVDMSNTYLKWAERNFSLNRIDPRAHQRVQADCLQWLQQARQGFDIILLDPPTFSNSKRMENVLDVQRDHVQLVQRCMELLNPQGVLYFSNNLQSFRLDRQALAAFDVVDIGAQTLDQDFLRHSKIHHCYSIRHHE